MGKTILESTSTVLNSALLKKIKNTDFCIVGCGGVGAFFAEMLVRTGALNISLIDGQEIEMRNLNRGPFTTKDVGKHKTLALKQRLELINKDVKIKEFRQSFGYLKDGDEARQKVRDTVFNSEITLISVDHNEIRIECEGLLSCNNKDYLVIGIEISESSSHYVCGWKTRTDEGEKDSCGYGETNGSYMAIVAEAVAAGFHLMLHNISDDDYPKEDLIQRKYQNYYPVNNQEQ